MNTNNIPNKQGIKRAPEIWKKIPYFNHVRGMLFLRTIYLRADLYDNLNSDNPSVFAQSILVHEQTHYNRMKKIGIVFFALKYLFSRKYRFEEEVAAISAQMKIIKQNGERYDIESTAIALSSWIYVWCASYNQAYERLSIEWNNA